ncbi:hypothetical protein AVEN_138792-1 [Araneus ventricosus]|uniref:Uncharacterized protein n=1 Tax=Araneus ventricosus TaxID=182803 RepID=A0A4Y2M3W7_ARAVE|nr:hypothetical protein AVEN_138792-1 [Araneus ventricosus]
MTKRALEESPSGCNSKDRRISYLFINNLSVIQKATTALETGCGSIKLCIESTAGPSLWVKPSAINTTFGSLTHEDGFFFVNKNRKLILVTNRISSIEKVAEFVHSTPNAIVRLIDSNIVTKYIVRDVETGFILEYITKEIASQDILVTKIVRLKKKGTSEPIPIILIDEIGKTNRSEIKIGRVIFSDLQIH